MTQLPLEDSHRGPVGHEMIKGTLDTPVFQCDLRAEIQNLHKEDAWLQNIGPSSKTLVKHPDLRVVLIAMRGKMSMPQHTAAPTVSIQTLEGRIRLRLPDRTVELTAGHLLVLDGGMPHDVETDEDSAFLLTLSWHSEEPQMQG